MCRLWGFQEVGDKMWSPSTNGQEKTDGETVSLRTGVLPHSNFLGEKMRDVTSISWSSDGKRLASGCYDGLARIWNTSTGELK